MRVWQQWTNAHGGVNGHPVEVLIGDDGGDPGRYISIQRQFVEMTGRDKRRIDPLTGALRDQAGPA